jgi:hypothetical protein
MGQGAAVAAFAAVIAAMTGCAVPGPAGSPATASPDAAAYYERQGNSSEQALLAGRLALVHGCLVVQDAAGANTVPIFPKAWFEWDGAKLGYGNASFSLGEKVDFGGGFGGYVATLVGRAGVVVPAGCNPDAPAFFVQP